MRPPLQVPALVRRNALLTLATVAAAAGSGRALVRGDLESLLLLAVLVGGALLIVASRFGPAMLFGWIVLAPAGFPLLRVPRESALLTFDRLWIPALFGVVLFGGRSLSTTPATRAAAWCVGWLVVAYGVRALTTAPEGAAATMTWTDAILLPVILAMAARQLVARWADARRVTLALTFTGALLGLTGIVERFTGLELATLSGGAPRLDRGLRLVRVSGPYGAPEVYAVALLVCLAATLCWMQSSRGRPSVYVLGTAVAGVELVGITLTFFRAAWIAAAVVVIVMLGLRPGQRLRAVAVVAGVVCVLALVVFAFGRTAVLSERLEDTDNVYGRFAVYVQGVRIFQQVPLTGVGVGRFLEVQGTVAGTEVAGVRAVDQAHSSFVSVLAEQGVWGTVPLLAALIAVAALVRRYRHLAVEPGDVLLASAVVAAGLAYLVMSLTLTMLPYGPSNCLLAVLLGVAAARVDVLDGASLQSESAPVDTAEILPAGPVPRLSGTAS